MSLPSEERLRQYIMASCTDQFCKLCNTPPALRNPSDYKVRHAGIASVPHPNDEVGLASTRQQESVNHPAHYGGDTTYETIKVLEHWLTSEQMYGFCVGNSIKYLSRSGKKHGASKEADLAKATWYSERAQRYK